MLKIYLLRIAVIMIGKLQKDWSLHVSQRQHDHKNQLHYNYRRPQLAPSNILMNEYFIKIIQCNKNKSVY